MRTVLEEHFYKSYEKALRSSRVKKLENSVALNRKTLKEQLSKEQRVRLLRICDAKDLITEECSDQCFMAGFKLGLKIGYEANQ